MQFFTVAKASGIAIIIGFIAFIIGGLAFAAWHFIKKRLAGM